MSLHYYKYHALDRVMCFQSEISDDADLPVPRNAWKDAILEYSKELRLPMVRKYLEEHILEANQRDT